MSQEFEALETILEQPGLEAGGLSLSAGSSTDTRQEAVN